MGVTVMRLEQKVNRVFDQIQTEQGYVIASDVVEISRPEQAPLHEEFEWDDERASEKYRQQQARQLLRKVVINYKGKQIHRHHNVKLQISGKQIKGYVSIAKILSDEELKQQVLEGALARLQYWQQQYKNYQELDGIIDIEKLAKAESSLKNALIRKN